LKNWQITWEAPGQGTARATVRARDAEHAIKVWKRDYAGKTSVRAIEQVWKVGR